MNFQRVKNWGLALLILILLTFAALAHMESRLYLNSMHTMHVLYHPLLHRITQLSYLLKSTEINFEIFRRRDIPQLATNAIAIDRLSEQIEKLKASSNNENLFTNSQLEKESKIVKVAWKRFESAWNHYQDLSSDSIHQSADLLYESLEELKWQLISLRDYSANSESSRLIKETLSLIKSISDELDTFLTQEPIFIEDVLEPLNRVSDLLVEFDEQAILLKPARFNSNSHSEHSWDHGSNHNHSMPDMSGSNDITVGDETEELESVSSINRVAIHKTEYLQTVLRQIQSADNADSATYQQSVELARKLITEIENQFTSLEFSLTENMNATDQLLINKLNRYQQSRHLVTILGCVLALLVSTFLSIKLSRHVALVTDGTRTLADGNLDHRIPASSDQLGEISNAFNLMAEKMRVRDHERNELMQEIDRSAKEASKANAAKGEFMASMSHEIRTPINGVLGTVDLLRREPLSNSQKHLTDTIYRSGNALLAIINDILDYSKIEAGSMELENEPFDLSEMIEDIGEMAAPSAQSKDLELNYVLNYDTSQQLLGDALRIRQILTNLVSNAIKFTEQGDVCITAEGITTPNNTAQLRISVQDTGIGLSDEAQTRIFDEFSQASRSTTRKYGGTGLGLSISRQLTKMMNGTLSLESVVGIGSTFILDLELQISDSTIEQMKFCDKSEPLAVMILSDHKPTKEAISSQLIRLGTKPIEHSSGKKALDYLSTRSDSNHHDIAMIIVDHCLSDMNGQNFLLVAKDKLSELNRFSKIKLCMIDKSNNQNIDIDGFDIECKIKKPVRQSTLYDCLIGCNKDTANDNSGAEVAAIDKHYYASVLLVEDHPINQDIMTRMLSRMGCTVALAENGQIALAMMKQQQFDLVLMDCDMPVMDGFSATESYREYENQQTGNFRQPIVALTANALKGDRDRCLRAGMDDYASKPITMDVLDNVLSKWTNGSAIETSEESNNVVDFTENQPSDSESSEIDIAIVDQLISMDNAGSMTFFNELLSNFSNNWKKDSERLMLALSSSEPDNVRKMAHRLKSASSTMGAMGLSSIAAEIESSAKVNNLNFCLEKAQELPDKFESTLSALSLVRNKAA